MTRRVLITGFEPFGGKHTNASWEAVRRLPGRDGDIEICPRLLPVEYREAGKRLLAAAEEIKPDLIVCTGVASGRDAITPERIAVNWRSAAIPDNAGRTAAGETIDPAGPDGIFTRLKVEDMVRDLRSAGLPAAVSFTAGTFVCNDVFYQLMLYGPDVPRGFIHVPTEERLSSDKCRDGLMICLRTEWRAESEEWRVKSGDMPAAPALA